MKRTPALCALPALAVAAVLVLAGCGDDSSDSPASSPSSAATPAASYDGVDPDGLVACLGDAGVPSRVTDTVPLGVEVPVVDVDADGRATLWVFRTGAEAADNRPLITLSDEDTPVSRLVDNVVVHYADLDTAPVDAVDSCLA
ncbi:hypothetical protein [Nocardioides sp.]|uniref:hypothetical protein n=1 Tax=Nocardioides sp. TaxID=35761 RepID=UPI0027157480|nr:hypothetical protein [Nocardioides sp.]MDO9456608.1 hypothetical protein [Nocardioides sp.]